MRVKILLIAIILGNSFNGFCQSELRTDTIITKVIIDNVSFTLKIMRDKYSDHQQEFRNDENADLHFSQAPITFTFIRNEDSKTVYSKKFEADLNDYPYLNYEFHKAQAKKLSDFGKLYLTMSKSYGGSGLTATLFTFSYDGKSIAIKKVTEIGELAYILYGKDDYEVLFLTGKWGDGESHFENHQYIVKKIELGKNFKEEYIGQTRYKYPSFDDEKMTANKLLDLIYKNEPDVIRSIDISNF